MSANAFNEDVSKAYGAGMDGYITKPMSLQKIKRAWQSIKEQEQRLSSDARRAVCGRCIM